MSQRVASGVHPGARAAHDSGDHESRRLLIRRSLVRAQAGEPLHARDLRTAPDSGQCLKRSDERPRTARSPHRSTSCRTGTEPGRIKSSATSSASTTASPTSASGGRTPPCTPTAPSSDPFSGSGTGSRASRVDGARTGLIRLVQSSLRSGRLVLVHELLLQAVEIRPSHQRTCLKLLHPELVVGGERNAPLEQGLVHTVAPVLREP